MLFFVMFKAPRYTDTVQGAFFDIFYFIRNFSAIFLYMDFNSKQSTNGHEYIRSCSRYTTPSILISL